MKQTYIVLIPVGIGERKYLENVENQTFDSCDQARQFIAKENDIQPDHIALFELSDFMDSCNNQVMHLERFWLGYIQIKQ